MPRIKRDSLPEPSARDTALLDLWDGLRSAVAGETMGVIAMWCDAHALPHSARLEVWERVVLVDRVVTDYHAAMAARVKHGR